MSPVGSRAVEQTPATGWRGPRPERRLALQSGAMASDVQQLADRFDLHPMLREHLVAVVGALPDAVRQDLVGDAAFQVVDFQPGGGGYCVPMAVPIAGGGASRCVVLKRTLCARSPAFIRYVIAHELAHAHLRNGGRWPGEDPEHAADALAAQWGWPRPPRPSD